MNVARHVFPEFKRYSRGELWADGVVHVLGVVGALVAVPVLVTLAAVWHGASPVVAAAAVYGVSMVAMFAVSASYHLVPFPRAKTVLRRLDHGTIFVKIAGTWTPFAVLLGGEAATGILTAIWSAALAGLALVATVPRGFKWLSLGLYLAMGWGAVAFGMPLVAAMSEVGVALVVTGGVLYTVGVAFHLWDRLPFQNAIWHAHVLAASFVFYAAVMIEVGAKAP
ncbi:MAG: hemolysin III family protein [Paracoccaceae bacterium]